MCVNTPESLSYRIAHTQYFLYLVLYLVTLCRGTVVSRFFYSDMLRSYDNPLPSPPPPTNKRRRDGKLFAMCKVEDGAVERVPDSSRYFVVKIRNAQGRHAFVGLAFDDRNQAFDFNVALQEFKK